MKKRNLLICLASLCLLLVFEIATRAQEVSLNYYYRFGRVEANEPPSFNGIDIKYPETARKNGVEGTLKASLVLGEDGKVRDIKIIQSLPFGVEEAVLQGLRTIYFKPAKLNGKPVAIPMEFDYIISVVYRDDDKNVTKPKITEKPLPVYPSKYAAEKVKGKVVVTILCFADGRLKVVGVGSTMPREFDEAALEAAAKIRFTPGSHKKSKADVSVQMSVEFEFKP